MNIHHLIFGTRYRSPEDDGGSGTVDRGDSLDDESVATAAAEAAAVAEKAAADKAAEKEILDDVAAKKDEEEQPRDKDGKFAKKDEEPRIPKSRFDEQIGKERSAREAAERRVAEMEQQLKQVSRTEDAEKLEGEIVELEKTHTKLLLDGEAEKAAEAMRQIRMKERQIAIGEATHMSAQAKDEAREEIRMDIAIERLQSEYPALDSENEAYDETLVQMTLAMQRQLMETERLPGSRALVKAAATVMERFSRGAAAEKSSDAAGLGAAKVTDRKAEQVAKNLDTSKRQPGSTKDVGVDSDKIGTKTAIDVSQLSFEEFKALPESTKAKLRGDAG